MFKIYPYHMGSKSAKMLAETLNCKRININGTSYRYRPYHHVLNWGSTRRTPYPISANLPEAVINSCDKRRSYHLFDDWGIPTVCRTSLQSVAREWLETGSHVYIRETCTGHGGEGIQILTPGQSVDWNLFRTVQLFTKGFKIHREFRIHIAYGQVLRLQEKKKRRGTTPDPFVRNHHNNWVFCVNDLAPYPETIVSNALSAVSALGLNFGAVDIAINRADDVCVFEVNSAPGIEPQTAGLYARAFARHFA